MTKKYLPTHQSETLILETIISHSAVSRTELTEITKLTKSSVSDVVKSLLQKHIIYESNYGNASVKGGRKPIYLNFNPKFGVAIGIEVGANFLIGCLSYLNGELIAKKEINKKTNAYNIVDTLTALIDSLILQMPVTVYDLIGISIAIPGTVSDNKIVFMPYLDYADIDIASVLADYYKVNTYLINEANASALGEYVFSSTSNNLININIREGIGAGIITNGKLFEGKSGKAGEIGHSILFPGGRKCPCGNSGCLEQYASTKQLYTELDYPENMNEQIVIDSIKKRLSNNDSTIEDKLIENSLYISIGMNNIIEFYDPETIIINSKLHNEIPTLIDYIKDNLPLTRVDSVTIKNSSLGGSSAILGCIANSLQCFLYLQNLKFNI